MNALNHAGLGRQWVALIAFVCCCATVAAVQPDSSDGFSQFFGIKKFSNFKQSTGASNETILTSPEIVSRIPWDELVLSWNVDAPAGTYLKVEARAIYEKRATRFYTLALWSPDGEQFPRESVRRQKDDDGDVKTDILVLKEPAMRMQVRLTLGSASGNARPKLKYLGFSFCNTKATPVVMTENKAAWGKALPVIERSQNSYPDEKGWCSPTSLSMVLTHWSDRLRRKEMALDVPEVAAAVLDKNFGTGNWPFNTAYAGSFKGMRSYVTRFGSIGELEEWIAAGIPVIISAPWHLLQDGRRSTGSGHVVTCVGFTETGDVYVNDPGTNPQKDRVRHIFKRQNVINAWRKSRNTVYLVYPESAKIPRDRLGHWEKK